MNTTRSEDTDRYGRAASGPPSTGIGESTRQGSDALEQGAEAQGSPATRIAQDAKRQGTAQVDEYRNLAAQKMDILVDTVRAAAARLEGSDLGHWSAQISGMADSMSTLSQGLREKSADEIMHDVKRLAKENPAIVVGSAVAIGFGLARLARAKAQPRPEQGQSSFSSTSSDATGIVSGLSGDRDGAESKSAILSGADLRLPGDSDSSE